MRKYSHYIYRCSWIHWILPRCHPLLGFACHNFRAPCHLCSFIRQDRIGPTDLPYYGCTTSVHSKATSFCRPIDRMKILCEENTAIQELNTSGFQSTFDVIENPLHALSEALKDARYLVPLTNGGDPIVPALFDPYRSSVVASDNLQFGFVDIRERE
jgi:hypothetical protein